MIPNSAPMAAVYLQDGELFSRPVAAWSDSLNALVIYDKGETRLLRADREDHPATFLGIWQGSWTPSCAEMGTLVPDHVPGTPHPLSVPVVVRRDEDGWFEAARESDGMRVATAPALTEIEYQLRILGQFRIVRVEETADGS